MNNSPTSKSFSIHLVWPIAAIILLFIFRAIWGSSGNTVGEKIYKGYCSSCHGEAGEGFGELVPPLAGADYLQKNQDNLPCIIQYGLEGLISVNGNLYNQPMAGVGFDELGLPRLSPTQIQQLINFIQSNWGNDGPKISRQQVTDALESCRVPDFK